MPNAPAWSENLSVGNRHVDHQHQELITLCNRAADCAASTLPESRSVFHAILNELATLASRHFDDEEKFLKLNKSPSLVEHAAEHTKYREIITNLLIEGSAGQLDRAKLHQVASDYLIKHMLTMDLADKEYLQTHQSI